MNDIPPHRERQSGIEPDSTLQPDHKVGPVTMTIAALFSVVVLTLVIYGMNASSPRTEMASNSPPAQQGGGNAGNPPGATKAQPQSTTASQAPAGQPAAGTPNAAPAKPDG